MCSVNKVLTVRWRLGGGLHMQGRSFPSETASWSKRSSLGRVFVSVFVSSVCGRSRKVGNVKVTLDASCRAANITQNKCFPPDAYLTGRKGVRIDRPLPGESSVASGHCFGLPERFLPVDVVCDN